MTFSFATHENTMDLSRDVRYKRLYGVSRVERQQIGKHFLQKSQCHDKTTTSTSKRASVREEGLFVFGGPTAFFEDLNHLLNALALQRLHYLSKAQSGKENGVFSVPLGKNRGKLRCKFGTLPSIFPNADHFPQLRLKHSEISTTVCPKLGE
nr:uncharacterized protein LOC118879597 [Drosophila suzukii]